MSIFEEAFTFNYFGHTINARSLGTETIPATSAVTSVHVAPVTPDGEVVTVNIKGRGFDIPGGHIDEGEDSPVTALNRELREEANITIFAPILIDVLRIQCDTLDLSDKPYMLLYAARVDQMNDFTANDEVSERVIMQPDEFINNYFGNKRYCSQFIKRALEAAATEELPMSTPKRSELLDDNARKFVSEAINHDFLEKNGASSFTLIVDWLETREDNEKKVAYKQFDNGDIQILLISKVTKDGKRTSEKKKITEEKYKELLSSSVLHLEKKRHEFEYTQNNISFSIKYDEFAEGRLYILEVDAPSEEERNSFHPGDFPAQLAEVTGDIKYYGYRVAGII